MQPLAIVNARIVNEGRIIEGDLLVRDGRIAAIGASVDTSGAKVIDAAGKHLLPGVIDDQVHFREPGITHKADILHESRAAVAGGTTSFMEMPNTVPAALTRARLEDKYAIAARTSLANHAFYLGASNDNLDEVRRLDPQAACGVKVFMGSSTGNMLVDRPTTLRGIFRDSPVIITTHCEDTPTIQANEAAAEQRWGRDVPIQEHPRIRSREACYASSSLAVELASEYDARLHILHLTTAEELALFRAGPLANKRITAEACVHHLWFTASDYHSLGTQIKCNPAIKQLSDREALRRAVKDDVIDVIATDHAPHTWAEKQGDYFAAPSGLPYAQHSLAALLELVQQGVFSLTELVRKTSHAVADLFEIRERGYLREGYWADLVLVDLDDTTTVSNADILSKCRWSPFAGETFRCRVCSTIVSGHLAWHEGQLDTSRCGRRLSYTR